MGLQDGLRAVASNYLGAIGGIEAKWSATDDRWYQQYSEFSATSAGVPVTADSAMLLSAVARSVFLLGSLVGFLSAKVYRDLGNGKKEEARDHPSWSIVHRAPNARQTRSEYTEQQMADLLLRGNWLDELEFDATGMRVTARNPIPWTLVDEVKFDDDGQRLYIVRDEEGGSRRTIRQRNVSHVHLMSLDGGLTGASRIRLARESIGYGRALQIHGARFFGAGARIGGVMHTPRLSDSARERNKAELEKFHGGPLKSHRTLFIEGEWSYTPLGINNEDSQFLESQRFSVADVARWFGIPPHLLMETDKSTSWGTGIEQQSLGFVKYTLAPLVGLIEQALTRDLLWADRDLFVEFNFDSLLRGDAAGRSAFYRTMREVGGLTANEIRRFENLPPRDDAGGDRFLRPGNLVADDGSEAVITEGG